MCVNCSRMKKICEYAAELRRRGKGRKASNKKTQEASDRKTFDIDIGNGVLIYL